MLSTLEVIGQTFEIKWQKPKQEIVSKDVSFSFLSFENGVNHSAFGNLPIFIQDFPDGHFSVLVSDVVTAGLSAEENNIVNNMKFIPDTVYFEMINQVEKGVPVSVFRLLPFIKSPNGFLKVMSFKITLSKLPFESRNFPVKRYKPNSVLATGNWYKLSIPQDGVYHLNSTFFTQLGINVNDIDPRTIKIFTIGGNVIPQANNAFIPFDLIEMPILVIGEQDGRFNEGDHVVFYGQGPHRWQYESINRQYRYRINPYTDTAYVFLTFGGNQGIRVSNMQVVNGTVGYRSDTYDMVLQHERDQVNFLKSGREWFGEEFDLINSRNFPFNIPDLLTTEPVRIHYQIAARSMGVPATFQVRLNGGNNILSQLSPNIISSNYLDAFAYTSQATFSTMMNAGTNVLNLQFIKPTSFSVGWLDYIQVTARCNLRFRDGQMIFRDALAFNLGAGRIKRLEFQQAPANITVWDVTNPFDVFAYTMNVDNNKNGFQWLNDSIRVFAAFDGTSFMQVSNAVKISNQNLHATPQVDMVIVTHPDFMAASERLANHHRNKTGLKVAVVNVAAVYNEFSGGRQDIMAIRRLMKLLYDRAAGNQNLMPKHLLLMGATSFDPKNRVPNNTNFIPTFQSLASLFPTSSYCSDAFYALLDDNEGDFDINLNDRMDINVGRLPVRSLTEAMQQVQKIETYTSSASFGDWKNIVTLVADDEDQNVHLLQANELGNVINQSYPTAVIEKIYLDMYRQVSVPGGSRYPDVNQAINNRVQNGSLIVNYTGHGGETGWAEERVLTIADINSWTNMERLSVFVTATCEFTRYDDPSRISAGELVLLNPRGGAIAMLTTTRLTFSTPNFALSTRLYRNFTFQKGPNGNYPTLGDTYRNTVNVDLSNVNTRCFALLGDPAISLAIPKNNTIITHFNQIEITSLPDTLKALARVNFSGQITDENSNLINDFNGIIFPTVFDKESAITTLGNDPQSSRLVVTAFRNIIHRGRASVSNGKFNFSFIVPKDIAYQYGKGRINTYAFSGEREAAGRFDNIIVGGAELNVPTDDKGPDISLFLNDNRFVNGGITHRTPVLIAKLADESGLNTVGNGIGHDLIAILNENSQNPIVLNNFYKSEIDDFTRGSVSYQMPNLPLGKNTLTLRAWDVYNNSNEKRIDFIVTDGEQMQIKNLLNYPNPFTTQTTFHFDHNRPNEPLNALLQIYSVSGKLVKSMHQTILSSGFHVDSFTWDGLDDFGDKIGRGVYIYRLKLKGIDGKTTEAIQKLVIF